MVIRCSSTPIVCSRARRMSSSWLLSSTPARTVQRTYLMMGCMPLPRCERRRQGSLTKGMSIRQRMKENSRFTSQLDLAAECCVSSNLAVQQNSPIMLACHLCKPQSRDESPQDHRRQVDVSCCSARLSTQSLHERGLLKHAHFDTEACPSCSPPCPSVRTVSSTFVAPNAMVPNAFLCSVNHLASSRILVKGSGVDFVGNRWTMNFEVE